MIHPRTLIVYKNRVTEHDSSGASVGRWFADWPTGSLLHVFTGGVRDGIGLLRASEYCLQASDRRLGWILDRFKQARSQMPSRAPGNVDVRKRASLKSIVQVAIELGLWEELFLFRASPKLQSIVQSFQPEVIYAQCSDLTTVRMALWAAKQTGAKLCVQLSDDFPGTLYGGSLAWEYMVPRVQRLFRELFAAAEVLLGTGEEMRQRYLCVYGRQFIPLYLCDSRSRFQTGTRAKDKTVTYIGNLEHGRRETLRHLIDAVRENLPGWKVKVYSQSSFYHPGIGTFVELHTLPSDADVPIVLMQSSVLVIVEGFGPKERQYAALSISTKAHMYMFSSRPIVVLAPEDVGVARYAKRCGWGLVVSTLERNHIAAALLAAGEDCDVRAKLLSAGEFTADSNHECCKVRERFLRALQEAMGK